MLLAVYLFFSFNDMQTSAQTGNSGADRGLAHAVLLVLTGYLIFYFFQNTLAKKLKLQVPSSILKILFFIMGWILLVDIICTADFWSMAVQINMSLLWILSFYFFSSYVQKQAEAICLIDRFVWVVMLFYCVSEVYYIIYMMGKYNRFPVLNLAYNIVALLPWLLINPKCNKKLVYAVTIIAVFASMKRGAIISIAAMLLIETWADSKVKKKPIKALIKISIVVLALFAAFGIADYFTNGLISTRFSLEQLESGSGRMDMWGIAIKAISERNVFSFLIGGGNGSSVALLGTGVHNEWLEFLFSFGAIGLLFYIGLIISFVKQTVSMFHRAPEYAPACCAMLVFYLIISMVSTGYGGYVGFLLFGFWGYVDGLVRKKERKPG